MKTVLPCIPILLLLIALGSAADTTDAEIQQIQAKFGDKRQKLQRDARARYADSLASLRQELLQAGKSAEAEVVAAELKNIMARLNAASAAAREPTGSTSPANMEDVFTELQKSQNTPEKQRSEGEKSPAKEELEKAPKIRRRYDLDFKEANLSNGPYSGNYWYEGASASWKLNTLPPGEYTVRLSYRADPDQKPGECEISIQGTEKPISVEVKPEGRRGYNVDVGKVKLTNTGDTFKIAAVKVAKEKSLFHLTRVTLIPYKEGEAPPAVDDDPK